jgi:hypothetical protein
MPEAAPVTMAVLPEISMAHDLQRRRGAMNILSGSYHGPARRWRRRRAGFDLRD